MERESHVRLTFVAVVYVVCVSGGLELRRVLQWTQRELIIGRAMYIVAGQADGLEGPASRTELAYSDEKRRVIVEGVAIARSVLRLEV